MENRCPHPLATLSVATLDDGPGNAPCPLLQRRLLAHDGDRIGLDL